MIRTKPDLITCWPVNLDYPPFRMFIHLYRHFFNKVIVSWTPMESMWDFRSEVMQDLLAHEVLFLESQARPNRDWRDLATNLALLASDSPWVLFMEQDFFIRSGGDLQKIWMKREHADVIGYKEGGTRLHPAFLLVKRSRIEKTDKDFSAYPDEGFDHFDKFTSQLPKPLLLDNMEIENGTGYKHMNGLTHNFNLCMRNEVKHIYKKDEFLDYLDRSDTNIEVSQKYRDLVALCKKVLDDTKVKKGKKVS